MRSASAGEDAGCSGGDEQRSLPTTSSQSLPRPAELPGNSVPLTGRSPAAAQGPSGGGRGAGGEGMAGGAAIAAVGAGATAGASGRAGSGTLRDPDLWAAIESEIVARGPGVQWGEIAGLETAKRSAILVSVRVGSCCDYVGLRAVPDRQTDMGRGLLDWAAQLSRALCSTNVRNAPLRVPHRPAAGCPYAGCCTRRSSCHWSFPTFSRASESRGRVCCCSDLQVQVRRSGFSWLLIVGPCVLCASGKTMLAKAVGLCLALAGAPIATHGRSSGTATGDLCVGATVGTVATSCFSGAVQRRWPRPPFSTSPRAQSSRSGKARARSSSESCSVGSAGRAHSATCRVPPTRQQWLNEVKFTSCFLRLQFFSSHIIVTVFPCCSNRHRGGPPACTVYHLHRRSRRSCQHARARRRGPASQGKVRYCKSLRVQFAAGLLCRRSPFGLQSITDTFAAGRAASGHERCAIRWCASIPGSGGGWMRNQGICTPHSAAVWGARMWTTRLCPARSKPPHEGRVADADGWHSL